MSRKALIALLVIVFSGTMAARWLVLGTPDDAAPANDVAYARIVSMAPSITETLFALGLDERIIGVTRYCDYPPEATELPQVGGFLDPNYEAIMALEPDLVLLLTIHGEAEGRLADLGVDTLVVEHRTLEGILESFQQIGETTDTLEAAHALTTDCKDRQRRVETLTAERERPRVLISSARELGSGRVTTVYAAGTNQWYADLIESAGGQNAFVDETIQFPAISSEGLLRLDPDIIIELAPDLDDSPLTPNDVIAEWDHLAEMSAVQGNRIHVLSGGHVSIPGPRHVVLLEEMARLLHPDADWSAP